MSLVRFLILLSFLCWLGSAFANPVTPGPNTILLDNFNGSTIGTAVGPLQFEPVQGGFGQAARFGPGNFIRYPVTLPSRSEGTIELWIKPDVVPATEKPGLLEINWGIQDSYPPAGHILHLGLWGGPNGELQISAWPGGSATGTTPLTTSGQWIHIAGSWGPQGTKVYINGRLDGSSPSAMNVAFSGTNYLYLNYYGDQRFAGLVDDLHMSNVQLPDAVIAEHAAVPPGLDLFVFPDKGGVDGTITLRFQGPNFPSELDSVALVAPGEPNIEGFDVFSLHADTAYATFDLTGAVLGKRDAVLSFNDGSNITIDDAFEIINSRGPLIAIDLLGQSGPRLGREASYIALIRNIGFNDLGLVSLTVDVTDTASPLLQATAATSSFSLLNTVTGGVAPGGSIPIPVTYLPPTSSCKIITATADKPKDPEDDDCSSLAAFIQKIKSAIITLKSRLLILQKEYDDDCWAEPPPIKCGSLLDEINKLKRQIRLFESSLKVYCAKFNSSSKCIKKYPGLCEGVGLPGPDDTPPDPSVNFSVCPITSWDPNEKVGLAGTGAEGYISSSLPLAYTVHFENLPTASASAQDVVVVDQLDADLDWTTFELGGIRFGERFVEVPPESQHFATTVDLRPGLNIAVEIDANLDPNTGRVTWQFRSIDPDTGGFPEDPSAGFLPPNIVPPEGEGSVSFTVRAKKNVQTGTEIHNQATIVFDVNPPIVTNQWVNTIDNSAPQSKVLPLAATQPSPTFQVQWAGTDGESGVREYTVYVSENDGPATVLLNNTTETAISFTGKGGSTYAFYSMAMDYAGNVEDIPQVPDTSTTVVANQPPIADAGQDQTVECTGPDGARVKLDGSKSTDPDGDSLSFTWTGPFGTQSGAIIQPTIPLGAHDINLAVADGKGGAANDTVTVSVRDTTPPTLSVTLTPNRLWPPNHKMVTVTANVRVSDTCDPNPTITLVSITSNEPDNGLGDGDTPNDIQGAAFGTDDRTFALRAERSGSGTGRIYTATYQAQDHAGNTSTATAQVVVPHDQR